MGGAPFLGYFRNALLRNDISDMRWVQLRFCTYFHIMNGCIFWPIG